MTVSTAFPSSRVARGMAIKTEHKNLGAAGTRFRPVHIGVVGQGNSALSYPVTKRRVYSAAEVGTMFGYDSPLYQAVLSLLPANGDGVGDIPVSVLPLAAPTLGTPAEAVGDITPTIISTITKTQTHVVKINNKPSSDVVVVVGDTVGTIVDKMVAAVNGVLGMPGTATDGTTEMIFTAGWEGASGNDIVLAVESPIDTEVSFAFTQPTGGAGTVEVNPVAGGQGLAVIGNEWITHIVNCLQSTDATNLDAYDDYNEGRWLAETHKPLTVYTGTAQGTLATVTAITDARKTDRTNVITTNPASSDLPCVIAADHVRRIAKIANVTPSHDYGRQDCPRLTPGGDALQWTSAQRQTAVLAGTSTIEVIDGEVNISDVVTCYHPTGEEPPAYRYCCDIEKIATMIYGTDLIFGGTEWGSGPALVPNDQAVREPTAKKPKMAEGELYKLIDNAALDAIISDPDFAKSNSSASINGTNPKRLDVTLIFKLAGNANVISIDLSFGFHYGQ